METSGTLNLLRTDKLMTLLVALGRRLLEDRLKSAVYLVEMSFFNCCQLQISYM